jgi:hypothetical protein
MRGEQVANGAPNLVPAFSLVSNPIPSNIIPIKPSGPCIYHLF